MKPCLALAVSALVPWLFLGCEHYQPAPLTPAATAAAFSDRSLADLGLKRFVEQSTGRPIAEWPLPSWGFESLVLAAWYFHPSLAVAQAQARVTEASELTAGGRPNPSLSLVPEYSFTPPQGTSPWLPTATLDWPIETAGKRDFRVARARHLSDSARLDVQTMAWQIRSNLRTNLLELGWTRERERLLSAQEKVLEQMAQLLQQRLQAGAVSRSEIMPEETIRARNHIDLAQARFQSIDARAAVAEALGLPVKALEQVELSGNFVADPGLEGVLDSADMRQEALQHRSDLLSALSTYAAAQSALQLEIARQYPDIHIGNGYQWDQGQHKWSLGVTVELPVLNRNEGPIAEAKAHRAEVAARFEALQAQVITELDRALTLYHAARQQLTNFDLYLGAQRRQFDAVQAQFNAGGADRLEVLHAQADLGLAELGRLEGTIRLQEALAALERALQWTRHRPTFLSAPGRPTDGQQPVSVTRKKPPL